jgi:hypothetical protein
VIFPLPGGEDFKEVFKEVDCSHSADEDARDGREGRRPKGCIAFWEEKIVPADSDPRRFLSSLLRHCPRFTAHGT